MKNIPNILTILRLLACPLIIYLFIDTRTFEISHGYVYKLYPIAGKILFVFIIASLTDFFDGYLSRKKKFRSNFGKILDPIADKALIITMLTIIIFGGSRDPSQSLGFHNIALIIIILRELFISSLRFNLKNSNQSINVSLLSKYKTFIQMLAIGFYLLFSMNVGMDTLLYSISIFLFWFSAYITFITGRQHYKTYLKLKK